MGNLYAESCLLANNLQNTGNRSLSLSDEEYTKAVDNGSYVNFVRDAQGYGLAQWTFWSRKEALLTYAKETSASIGDLTMQLDFLLYELRTSFAMLYATLLLTQSVREAAVAVLLQFERPADMGTLVQDQRTAYAQTFYDKYATDAIEVAVPPTTGTPIERLLATASAEVGYLEKASNSQLDDKTANAGTANYTKYARDLDRLGVYNFPKNGYAWCDMFVDWCFATTFGVSLAWQITNQPMGGCGAGCVFSSQYYQTMGRFHTSDPHPGDQIFFLYDGEFGHTGLVEKVDNGYVYTIEGNTSSDAGVVANGGSVNRKKYLLTNPKIGGYGRPNWDLVGNTIVDTVLSTEQEVEDVDDAKFKEMWLALRKTLQDNDDSAYSEEARNWAIATGLIQGGTPLPTGEPNYMWEDLMTREQMITVMFRFAQLMGKA